MPLFDHHLIVDWSAANKPTRGADSIWTAFAASGQDEVEILNHPTRSLAMGYIQSCIELALEARQRLFVGLDFAFGYPAQTQELPGGGDWKSMWSWLQSNIKDGDDNQSNRFDVAGTLNGAFKSSGPFWGHPATHAGRYKNLQARKPDYSAIGVAEKREIDALIPSAQPVWKLAYTGSVGSQSLLGIARLEKLRRSKFGETVAIWPFQTKFGEDFSKPVTIAEVYPSLFDVVPRSGEFKDAAQVRVLAEGFRALDLNDKFGGWLDGPREDREARHRALTHEAWMVGFTDQRLVLPESTMAFA